jgi:hypothetical protein
MNRLEEFAAYHRASRDIGDVDPQNACLKYVSNRFELSVEQRYWLAFLFGCCYSAPTVFYIYNEFPDFENVNVSRLQRWWVANKHRLVFQTDRLRVKTQDLFVETFRSYRAIIGERTQDEVFTWADQHGGFDAVWLLASGIRNFGRFSLFIYLELVHELTPTHLTPTLLDVGNALSSRNGLALALGLDEMVDRKLTWREVRRLEEEFKGCCALLGDTAWAVETTLCAFKKHLRGKRWVGYYLDRQHDEILKLQKAVPDGVCWEVLWQYRVETYDNRHLIERSGRRSSLKAPYTSARSFSGG